ncbi:MAG: isochorismatase family protein [Opitutaceae bacterium]
MSQRPRRTATATRRTRDSRHAPSHVLVIVDLQHGFAAPAALCARIRRYARRFRRRVFTQFVNPRGSLFRRALQRSGGKPGTREVELRLKPQAGDILIRKSTYGLRERDVRRLKAAGVTRATVCGIDTDACVLGVTFSLFDNGIVPAVKADLCWSSTGLHTEAMKVLREQFQRVK